MYIDILLTRRCTVLRGCVLHVARCYVSADTVAPPRRVAGHATRQPPVAAPRSEHRHRNVGAVRHDYVYGRSRSHGLCVARCALPCCMLIVAGRMHHRRARAIAPQS